LKVFIVDRSAEKRKKVRLESDSMRLLSSLANVFVSLETLVGHP
jgi:hypothetical protein